MVSPIGNLVAQRSISTGTGPFSINTVLGRQAFAAAFGTGIGNKFYYFISNANAGEWEVGKGYLSDISTLVRETVIESSNADALVNFSPGTKDVINDLPAAFQSLLVQPAYRLVIASTPVEVVDEDGIIEINQTTPGALTINIDPAALTVGKPFTIKDGKGDANSNHITIIPASGTFDGLGAFVMAYPYQAITFYSNGTNLRGIA